jgi:hypothetical protein
MSKKRSPTATYHLILLYLFLISLSTILGCNSLQPKPVNNVSPTSQYFETTDQVVSGEFLHFFIKYGGVESLGYPLTGEIEVEGWRVQYFEKGRLEYHPENEPDYRVTVGWLGDLLNRRRPPIPAASIPGANHSNSRYYPQTGHTISGDFLTYFDQHSGSVRFGLPISEPFIWQGKLAQDFQSARFFWEPEAKARVVLENIGQLHLETLNLEQKKESANGALSY